jgi:hypothetical protein
LIMTAITFGCRGLAVLATTVRRNKRQRRVSSSLQRPPRCIAGTAKK